MRNLKKILLSLGAAAAIAALATGGTFAVFTDQESIGSNDIDTGSVEIDLNDGSTDAIVDVSNMAIGDSMDGTLKVDNAGDNKASFVLTGSWADSAEADDLDDYVHITINDGTSDVVDDVTLSAFNAGSGVNVGTLVPGATKSYTIDVSLPSISDGNPLNGNEDNALQNLEGAETFTVDATQRAGVDHDIDPNPED